MRLFFAIELPPELKARLGSCQESLKPRAGQLRWSRPEDLHLTLAFLGECPPACLPQLGKLAAGVGAGQPAFGLRSAGLGGFPAPWVARVLWLGLEDSPPLAALDEALRLALSAAGFAFDPKPLSPHLTLARCPHPLDIQSWPGPDPAEFAVDGFALFESQSAPGGARYQVLERFRLGTR